ncbi:MAG: macro domain-containing protein [Planctomycetota bacterium]|nr:macro domain-containing protein [Planctomycetota bacterium]
MKSPRELADLYRDMEQSPDLATRVRYLSGLLRIGRLTQLQLELAAYLGHEECQIVTGLKVDLPIKTDLIESWVHGLKPFAGLLKTAPFVFVTEEFLIRPASERGIRETLNWRAWEHWDPTKWRNSRFLRGGLRTIAENLELPFRLLQHALWPLCFRGEFRLPIHVFQETYSKEINGATLELVVGDLTLIHSDILVNSASRNLAHIYGGFVNNTIHRAGGEAIRIDCESLGHCDTGDAKRSDPGRFFIKSIVHTVAPSPSFDNEDDDVLLAKAHRSCLELRGYPIREAAPIAMESVVQFLKGQGKPERVIYCLTTIDDFSVFKTALDKLN